jgi:hypothetical protein
MAKSYISCTISVDFQISRKKIKSINARFDSMSLQPPRQKKGAFAQYHYKRRGSNTGPSALQILQRRCKADIITTRLRLLLFVMGLEIRIVLSKIQKV